MAGPRIPLHFGIRWPREQVYGPFYPGQGGLDLRTELLALIDKALDEAKRKHLAIDWGSLRIDGVNRVENHEVSLTFYAEGEDTRDPLAVMADALADAERTRERADG